MTQLVVNIRQPPLSELWTTNTKCYVHLKKGEINDDVSNCQRAWPWQREEQAVQVKRTTE